MLAVLFDVDPHADGLAPFVTVEPVGCQNPDCETCCECCGSSCGDGDVALVLHADPTHPGLAPALSALRSLGLFAGIPEFTQGAPTGAEVH